MHKHRIAISAASMGRSFRRALRPIQESGAIGVQLQLGRDITFDAMSESGRRQLLRELGECELQIASIAVMPRRAMSDLDGLDERLDQLRQAMQLAFQLKTPTVSFRIGRIPEETSSTEYETLVAVLNDLARHANHVGAVPSITPSGDSSERTAALLAGVTQGPIGVTLDPALLVPSGLSAASYFREIHESVDQILIRDAVRDIDDAVSEVAVGRGEVAWDELLALVQEAEFRGWLTVTRTQGDDPAGDAMRAVSFVRNVMTE